MKKKKSKLRQLAEKAKDTTVKLGKDAYDLGRNTAVKAKDFSEGEIQKVKDKRAWDRAFKESTHVYELVGVGQPDKPIQIRAFRDIDTLEVFVKSDEKVIAQLKSGTILNDLKDGSRLKVTFVDDSIFTMKEFPVEEEIQQVQCVRIKCILFTDEKPKQINNIVNQNLSINNSNVDGGVYQISDISNKLDEFEIALKSFKPKLFNKRQHVEVLKVYGEFKQEILNQRKDSSVVKQFLDLLSYAPALLGMAKEFLKI